MPARPVTVYTGDGPQSLEVPDTGATDTWTPLSDIAAAVKTGIDQYSLHKNSIFLGAPEGTLGVVIPGAASVDIPVPPDLQSQFGKGCIPLLMVASTTPPLAWRPVKNYSTQLKILLHNGPSSAVPQGHIVLSNPAVGSIYVRGFLWFPKLQTDVHIAKIL